MRKKIVSFTKDILRKIVRRDMSGKLGYSKKAKLLIIHADDLGLSKSANKASFQAMEKGMVNSGSAMVPCPGIEDTANYVKMNPDADIGIHLTVTCEWPHYKWSPVSPVDTISSLLDNEGYFFENTKLFSANADPAEVEHEFRAQIDRAMSMGIKPTHLDSHMYAAFANKDILNVYISIGKEFNLPGLMTYDLPVRTWFMKNLIFVDRLYCASPEDYDNGLDQYYRNVLETLKPGLNCLLIHPAFDDREMQLITKNQSDFGSRWRQKDYDFFTSNECRRIIENNEIKLVTWREIQEKIILNTKV